MANTDKNIVITPNIGASADPKIVFSGADSSTAAQNITLQVYPTNNGTLSFEGSAGQLFSITNSLTGTIYSVNDVSGIPSIEVLDTGLIKLAQYGGNVLLGSASDNATDKLQVTGSANITGAIKQNGNQVLHSGNYNSYALPLSGGTLTGKVTYPSAIDSRPQFPNGILGLDVSDGNFDIWGISRDYYPSHATAASQWGIRWDGDSNQVRFIGGGTVRLSIDLDGGSTGALQWEGYNIWHAGNLTNLNQLTNGPGYITGESDTLATVTARGSSHSATITWNGSAGSRAINYAANDGYASMRVIQNAQASGVNADGMYIGYQNGNSGITRIFGGGVGSGALEKYSTYSYEPGSFRAPIFYDSDNTAAYANLAQTSGTIIATGASSDTLGYNSSYGIYIGGINGRYLYSGNSSYSGPVFWNGSAAYTVYHTGNVPGWITGESDTLATVTSRGSTTSTASRFDSTVTMGAYNNSNSYIAFNNSGTYWGLIGNYDSNDWRLGYGSQGSLTGWGVRWDASGNAWSSVSHRAPIFYDSDDTGYYVDPAASTSLRTVGDWRANASAWTGEFSGKIQYHSNNWYFQAADQFIWRNSSGTNVVYGDQSGNHWATTSSRSPIFYDNNDTGYYCDPNSTSRLNTISTYRVQDGDGTFLFKVDANAGTTRHINLADSTSDPSSVGSGSGITWGTRTDGNPYYMIYCKSPYSNGYSTHSRLTLAWHTGIEIGASPNYGGTRFFNNSPFTGGEIMRVGSGDSNVYINNTGQAGSDFRAPIFYDSNDTGKYIDGNNTSVLNAIQITGYNGAGSALMLNWPTSGYIGLYGSVVNSAKILNLRGTSGDSYPVSVATLGGFASVAGDGTNGQTSAGIILAPQGGQYATTTSTVTGAIKIRLPNFTNDAMFTMTVRVYTYDGASFEVVCGGYPYSNTSWANVFAYLNSGTRNYLTVRFGYDGNGACVWIGETSTSWSYPQVHVMDFTVGYYGRDPKQYAAGWLTTIETAFNTVYTSVTAFPQLKEDRWQNSKYFGTDGAIYGTIFYDANDSTYRCDPNGNTVLNTLDVGGNIGGKLDIYAGGAGGVGWGTGLNIGDSSNYTTWIQDAGVSRFRNLGTGGTDWYNSTAGTRIMFLDNSGNVTFAGNVTANSDIRLKTNIKQLTNGLEIVRKLRGVSFDWIESGEHSIGVIAQEVEAILPEVVLTTQERKPGATESREIKSVDYSKIVSVLIEAVKEQQSEIDELKSLVKQLLAK